MKQNDGIMKNVNVIERNGHGGGMKRPNAT